MVASSDSTELYAFVSWEAAGASPMHEVDNLVRAESPVRRMKRKMSGREDLG